MTKVILITGCGGFVASHIANYFSSKNYKVYANYRSRISKLIIKRKNLIELKGNILLMKNFPKKCDIIIHCAYQINSKKINKIGFCKKNLNMLKILLEYACEKNVQKLFFMSSISIYGKLSCAYINENSRINNPDFYGRSKLFCEKLLSNNKKIKSFILRLPGVIGIGFHSIFLKIINNKIKSNEEVLAYNLNSKFNNVVHVKELSRFILKLISCNNYKKNNYVFNLASSYPLKIKKVIEILFKMKKKKINIKKTQTKKKSFLINFDYAKKFGFKAISVKKNLNRINLSY
jgi:nucleoside-diphosphate-sugar epimerase